jgi:glucose-6-phosphate 1-dehydrogenase
MKFFVKYFLVFLLPFCSFASDQVKEKPTVLVIFGATGDLTSKKILPAVEHLTQDGQLPERFTVVGVARKTEEMFRKKVASQIHYVQGDFDEDAGYERLAKLLDRMDQDFGDQSHRIFFLSTPPKYFSTIVEKLHQHKMIYKPGEKQWSRVLIEKPFGTDLQSAIALQKDLSKYLDESQIYRIDHYLGKEGVKNLTDFRLGQKLESVWNNKHIDRVQITISEDIGIGSRAQFWEETGLLRDIVQNHLMQLLSLVAMDVRSDLPAEKIKVLHAIRPLDVGSVVRGQYGPGEIKGEKVPGYKEEEGVPKTSSVETYLAATLFIDNERWKGVPFAIQAGKRLPAQLAEIVVHFKSKEALHIRIQPKPAIFFEGGTHFSFEPSRHSEAYQKLIIDCIKGDQSSFVQGEEQMAAWRLLTPVLEHWKAEPHISTYPAGTWGNSPIAQIIDLNSVSHLKYYQPGSF